jgi:hypothetical protein
VAQAERRARGWVSQRTRKEPATFAGKTAEVQEFLSIAGSLTGYCKSFYDKCADLLANKLQTTRKRKFRFAKCGKW